MLVIVHGGASDAPEDPDGREAVLNEAAALGADTGSPVDAVEAAIRRLESSPRFNAGAGGAVQSDGVVRTDAGIMTSDRDAGAACSMPGVAHAVSVARAVMEQTPHVLLAGEHAVEFADETGFETGADLRTDRTRDRWQRTDAPPRYRDQIEWVRREFGGSGEVGGLDTVGAVAVGKSGIAAATSTGGRWGALAGRVGDVPQIGSGFYASPAAGASATGAGEDIAMENLSRRAVGFVEDGFGAAAAADRAIDAFASATGSVAGVIVADRSGAVGSAFNTESMQTAVTD